MSNPKVEETWSRLNGIDDAIRHHKDAIDALEKESDEIHTKCEKDTTRLVVEELKKQDNKDLFDLIMAIPPEVRVLSGLHELCSEDQWQRWHKLQKEVSETTGMYFDSGASQSLFIGKIWHRLKA